MTWFLLFLDVSPEPVGDLAWGPLILLLAVVLILSVVLVAGLIFLLIWLKRRKLNNSSADSGMSRN